MSSRETTDPSNSSDTERAGEAGVGQGSEPAKRPPVTDSPWFWAHVFCVAALAGLAMVGPRAQGRQGQLDRNFSARQKLHAQRLRGDAPSEADLLEAGIEPGANDGRWVDFRIFYGAAATGAIVAWVLLWRERAR